MFRSHCIILIYLLVALPPAFSRGQQKPTYPLMQLVRLYEAAQDSVFMPEPTPHRSAFLGLLVEQSDSILGKLQSSADTNMLRVADYLHTALRIYARSSWCQVLKNAPSAYAPLKELRSEVDRYSPDDFPMRFTVLGRSIVFRYESAAPDLLLYYNALAPQCSCRELRRVISHLRVLQAEELAQEWSHVYRKKCRRRISASPCSKS